MMAHMATNRIKSAKWWDLSWESVVISLKACSGYNKRMPHSLNLKPPISRMIWRIDIPQIFIRSV